MTITAIRRTACALTAALFFLGAASPTARGKAQRNPVEGQSFTLSPSKPKYVTCDVEFRDPEGKKWPMFFYGKPASDGSYTYSAQRPSASFTVKCDKMCQPKGDHGRRVLGELAKGDTPPVVTFAVTSASALQKKTDTDTDSRGRKRTKSYEYSTMKGALDVGGRKVSVEAEATFKYKYGKNASSPESVYIDMKFTVKGKDLGLRADDAPAAISVRVGTTAYATK